MHDASAAIFIDRDGVINQDNEEFIKNWDEFIFLPRAMEGLKQLAALPAKIIVVTNQSGIARGLISEVTLEVVHKNLLEEVARGGARIDAIRHCPHGPDFDCECRKPKPGMILSAVREMNLDLRRSWMIGDRLSDMEAAQA